MFSKLRAKRTSSDKEKAVCEDAPVEQSGGEQITFGGKMLETFRNSFPGQTVSEGEIGEQSEGEQLEIRKNGFDEAKLQKIKRGDYIVQVHVIEARDLMGRGFGDMSDPVTTVEVMGQKKSTKIHKSCLNCVFDQVLTFELSKLVPAEIKEGKIRIDVMDANNFFRNKLIGTYEFDALNVYLSKNHEIHRQWVALSDVTDMHDGAQGYLRVSVVVLGPNDEQKVWTKEEDEEEEAMVHVLMPPQIKQTGYLLKVQIFEVEGLPAMGFNLPKSSICDPLFVVEFAGIKVQTTRFKGQKSRVHKEIHIPVMEPIIGSAIRFRVMHHRFGKSDDLIASTTFNYNEVKACGPLDDRNPHWVSLYGAAKGKQGKGVARKLNRGHLPGSTHRGRVLIRMEVVRQEEPKKCVIGLSTRTGRLEYPKTVSYTLQMDLYEGSEICEFRTSPDMHVAVRCGDYIAKSNRVPVKAGRCEWYEVLADGNLSMTLPEDTSQCPDVFVYLCHAKKRVCYIRMKFAELMSAGWGVPPSWHILQEDKSVNGLPSDTFAGSLLYSLRLGLLSDCPKVPHDICRPYIRPCVVEEDIEEEKPPEPSTFGFLTLTILRGENLTAPTLNKNKPKLPDAFVRVRLEEVVRLGEKPHKLGEYETSTVEKCANPKWEGRDQAWELRNPISVYSTLVFTVRDHRYFALKHEFGKAKKMIKSFIPDGKQEGQDIDQTLWIDGLNKDFEEAKIQVRVRFNYLAAEEVDRMPQNERGTPLGRPKRIPYQLRAFVYQCRNVIAGDKSGLSDPYAVVRACGEKQQTHTVKSTLNAEWYKTLVMDIDVVEQLELAPDIVVQVMDEDVIGSDDLLGYIHFPMVKAESVDTELEEPKTPKWMKLHDSDNKLSKGEILISFKLLKLPMATQVMLPRSLRPPTNKRWLQVVTLGVRDLNSAFGVTKPFLQFKLPRGAIFNTLTSSKPSPSNANFLQILKIPLEIPVDRLYAPMVTLNAKDSKFGGYLTIHLASAAINVDMYMPGYAAWRFLSLEKLDFDVSRKLSPVEMEELEKFRAERERANIMKEKQDEADRKAADQAGTLDEERRRRLVLAEITALRIRDQTDQRMAEIALEGRPEKVDSFADHLGGWMRSKADWLENKANGVAELPVVAEREYAPVVNSDVVIDIPPLADELVEEHKEDSDSDGEWTTKRSQAGSATGSAGGLGRVGERSPSDSVAGSVAGSGPGENSALLSTFPTTVDEAYDMDTESNAEDLSLPHYMIGRNTFDDGLEDVMELSPFTQIDLFSGNENGTWATYRKRGAFKGLICVTEEKDADLGVDLNELLCPQKVVMRLYVLKAYRLTPKDRGLSSDPYLRIRLGNTVMSTRKRFFPNSLDPEFFESFEIPCVVPGDAKLHVEVWDRDGVGHGSVEIWDMAGLADDLIGSTVLDIEDRWFSPKWREIAKKPVEWRTLHAPTSSNSQGTLQMWVEVMTTDEARKHPMVNITPPPPAPFEMRVIVWGCRDVTINDTFTHANDLYVTGALDVEGLKPQCTDTHARSHDGAGNFNWRMKFPVELPMKRDARFRLQVWDKDYFSPNDSISETVLSLNGLFRRAFRAKDRVIMNRSGKDRIWLNNLRHPNYPGNQGRVEVSFEIMPQAMAQQLPAGFGRSDPNMNPVLPHPEGRFQWSFNPLSLLKQTLGGRMYYKFCCGFCCLFIVIFLIVLLPNILGSAIGSIF
eukprot:1001194_1